MGNQYKKQKVINLGKWILEPRSYKSSLYQVSLIQKSNYKFERVSKLEAMAVNNKTKTDSFGESYPQQIES